LGSVALFPLDESCTLKEIEAVADVVEDAVTTLLKPEGFAHAARHLFGMDVAYCWSIVGQLTLTIAKTSHPDLLIFHHFPGSDSLVTIGAFTSESDQPAFSC
jgi:hypothetical protein